MTEIQPTIRAGEWRCDSTGSEIVCCLEKDVEMEGFGCLSALDSNIRLRGQEEGWQPKSIDVPLALKLKCLSESGRKICFFPEDLRRSWPNADVNALKGKRAGSL